MLARPLYVRLIGVALVVMTLATACRATPTATPPEAAPVSSDLALSTATSAADAPSSGGGAAEPTVSFTFDPRIDLRLIRNDIDCGAAALSPSNFDNTRIVTAHFVVDGQLGARCLGPENQVLIDAWTVLVSTTPADHLQTLGVFVGYINELDIPAHESAIGIASSLGWSNAGAQISVDLDNAFADEPRLSFVLIHEMGHVLGAARSQTTGTNDPAQCTGFVHRFRCFRADALFTEFAALFWLDYLPSLDPDTRPSSDSGRWRCAGDSGFFNAYSASDPFEDFADSYAVFVQGFEVASPGQQARMDWFARQPAFVRARERAALLHPMPGWSMPQRCG